ncbi:hypothetical protein L1049_009126 [Liquidambar formosana]|uniref:DOG1 domain-containing protein n=1 Tax=Liquidambar formosana TaxID=63359 RepID=A0AAP0S460_LIQFO
MRLPTSSPRMPFRSGRRTNDNAGEFETFLEGWIVRQEHYLEELLSAQHNCHESRDDDLNDLISRVLSHYQHWFTSLERTFLWITGFKPGLTFRLVTNSVDDLSEDQTRRMNRLFEETKAEERILSNELATVQESIAASPMMHLARLTGRPVNGEVRDEEAVMKSLRSAMESVVARADNLRMKTTRKVVEILSPVQNVKFLTAATQLQLSFRSWGLQRDSKGASNE